MYPDDIKSIPIPIVPEDVQKIVNECEKADKEFETAKNSIIDLKIKLISYLMKKYNLQMH